MHVKNNNYCCDVVIPTCNSGKYITQAINSVISQTNIKTQIYIIDDGSTDNTKKLILPLINRYKNIYYIYQNNTGLSSARNKGILAGKNHYIAFLDSDDVWKNNKLIEQFKIFEKSKDQKLGVVYCNYSDIDEEGKRINFPSYRLNSKNNGDIQDKLIKGNIVASSGSGVLVKRECLEKVGLFDELLPTCEDWDMWLRISKQYHYDYVQKKLVLIRRTKASMSTNKTRMCLGIGKLMEKHQSLLHSRQARKYFQKFLLKQILREYPDVKIVHYLKKRLDFTVYNTIAKDYFGMIICIFEIVISNSINKIKSINT
jgi:glycosyltransferase involved in cell wall biosynthesis